jgi:hypothetical protein
VARSEHAPARPGWTRERAAAAVAAVPMAAWVTALVAVSTIARYFVARGIEAPFIFQDELLYSELAKGLGTSGHFALRDVPGLAGISPVYPTLISPAYAIFDSIPHAYGAVKAINALLMSLAAVPAYLIARRLVGPWPALLAAALAVAIPDLLLTGTVMTENAFYPAFLLWFLLLVRMLERPTILSQVAVFGALLLAYETRSQAVALVPALVTALLLMIVAEALAAPRRREAAWERARAYWPTWGILATGALLFVVVEIGIRGRSVSASLFKTYAALGSVHYTFGGVAKWFLYHLGELDLVTGVIPFAAFIVVVCAAFVRPSTPALRAFALAGVAASFWIVLVVAAFASSPYTGGQRLEERNDFYVMPIFLTALVVWAVWLAGRLPRASAVAATVAAAAVALVPVTSFLNANALTDAFGLVAIWWPQMHNSIPLDWVMPLLLLLAIAAAALFLLVPARLALVLPVLVLALLAFANREANNLVAPAGANSLHGGIQVADENWIDRVVGGDAQVAAIFTNARPPQTLWLNEFFNRSIGPVYNVAGQVDGLPQQTVAVEPQSGRLLVAGVTPLRAQYVLTDTSQFLRGTPVAEDAGAGMRVYRVGGVVREVASLSGVYGDAWSGPAVSFTARDCHGGRLTTKLSGDPALQPRPQTVVATSGSRVLARIVVRPGQFHVPFEVPLRGVGGTCSVSFSISPTAVPATVLGTGDARELGIRFENVRYEPS